MNLFMNLLLTIIAAFFVGLFVVLATGSVVFMVIMQMATGVYMGFRQAQQTRRMNGKTE